MPCAGPLSRRHLVSVAVVAPDPAVRSGQRPIALTSAVRASSAAFVGPAERAGPARRPTAGIIGLLLTGGVLIIILREGRAIERIAHSLETFAATGAPEPFPTCGSPEIASLARRTLRGSTTPSGSTS